MNVQNTGKPSRARRRTTTGKPAKRKRAAAASDLDTFVPDAAWWKGARVVPTPVWEKSDSAFKGAKIKSMKSKVLRRQIQFRPASKKDFFDNWPTHWPDKKHFADQNGVQRAQYEALGDLIAKRCSERDIEQFLSSNREVLALLLFLFSTGHHASWIYPKHQIRPPSAAFGGLIPDYVLAGANSDGVTWFVLELKGANHSAFSKQGKHVFFVFRSQQRNMPASQLC